MKKIVFLLLVVFVTVSNTYAKPGDHVTYNGKTFVVYDYDQDRAIKEISNAKHVYCFEVVNFEFENANINENWDTMYNASTDEYAVVNHIFHKDEMLRYGYAIIFSSNGARMEKFELSTKDYLPGFEYANPSEVGWVGYSKKAGYCYAKCNGMYNSLIVYIK